ncbi:MAG: hypothetical protein SNJ77_08885, partial [Cytophagales bacterium]
MKKILTLSLIAIVNIAFAQKKQMRHWQMIESGQYTLQEIKEEAEKYFEGVDKNQKGTGYKQYKRWEYFAEKEADENGKIMSIDEISREMEKFNSNKSREENSPNPQFSGNWKNLGLVERSPTSSWNPGVGRVECISVSSSNPNHIIAGSPTGGLWRTTVGGNNWTSLTDGTNIMKIRGCAISPHNQNIYFVGTSTALFRSTNQGQTWTQVSSTSGSYSKIEIHPSNAQIVLASGTSGIFRSTDGGATFTRVQTGNFDDMVMRPTDPNIVYACTTTGFMRSTNNGQTWTAVSVGTTGRGRIAVTNANNSMVYYLQIPTISGSKTSVVYRSTDLGVSFTRRNTSYTGDYTNGYDWYGMDIAVSNQDANLVYCGGMEMYRSTDGGANFI